MAVSREAIVREAREWKGTKWRHQASMKGDHTDCAGLVVGVGLNSGALVIDFDSPEAREHGNYTRVPNPPQMTKALNHWMIKVPKYQAMAGDVVYREYDGWPTHLAILTSHWRDPSCGVIHALAWPSRAVVEHRMDDAWKHAIQGVWRYPNVLG